MTCLTVVHVLDGEDELDEVVEDLGLGQWAALLGAVGQEVGQVAALAVGHYDAHVAVVLVRVDVCDNGWV